MRKSLLGVLLATLIALGGFTLFSGSMISTFGPITGGIFLGVMVIGVPLTLAFLFNVASAAQHTHLMREISRENAVTHILHPNETGTYPTLVSPRYGIVRPEPGNMLAAVPHTYSPEISITNDYHSLKELQSGQEQLLLPASTQQPTQEVLLDALQENSLTFSPGIQSSNGKVAVVSIQDVPHLKIIGSTGFGKSCLAGAILDQVTQLNSPDVLQLALLDLEHKTSRLFEDLPHVAQLTIGNRQVDMIATNADEVAEHLGILKRELDRRTRLAEDELDEEPVLLMYVEEMLSLQYEVVDPKLLARMFADLTILAVRGRKYKQFLLSVMQTDYSTKEMQVTQKMFRFRSAAAVDVTAARAAGFINTDLIKENFAQGQPGQFVVEYPSFSDIVLAPRFDVKRLVAQKNRGKTAVWEPATTPGLRVVNADRTADEWHENDNENGAERAIEARSQEVAELLSKGWGKQAILEKVWRVKPGGSFKYRKAEAEYESIIQEQGA